MSINPLNDISQVYLEQVAFQEAKVDKMLPDYQRSAARNARYDNPDGALALGGGIQRARRAAHRERDELNKDAKDIRRGRLGGPQFQGETGKERIAAVKKAKGMKEALDPVGQEDADIDNDGDTDKTDKYLHNRRKAIGKAIAKKRGKDVKEGFSNWRQDLSEVMDDTEAGQKIKEKKVNNKIKINPKLGEAVEEIGGTLLEMFEIGDAELTEEVDIATEYFYEQGLNEEGIDILIEELGLDGFVDFVFEISEEYTLVEARTLTGKKKSPATGKERGVSLKAAPGKSTKAAVEKYGTTRKLSSSPSATIKKKSVAVKKAVEKQPETKSTPAETKKGIAGRVGAALGAAVKRGREDIKRVQDAAQTARNVAARRGAEAKAVYDAVRERGKSAEQSATATRARRKAKVATGRAVQAATPVVKKAVKAGAAAVGAGAGSLKAGKSPAAAAGRAAGTFVRKMTKEELELLEKAESEQQQKLFGLALSVKRGQTPRSEASPEVLKIVDSMSEKKIRDFAKTKHEGIPKKVEEELQPTTPQQFAAQRQLAMAQKKLTTADQIALQKKKKDMQQAQEEFVSEEDYDTMKDRHLERGGMGARSSTSPAKSGSSKPETPEERKARMEKQRKTAQRALELVRQQTMSKYGKGSLM
jgi:hypothetical protein